MYLKRLGMVLLGLGVMAAVASSPVAAGRINSPSDPASLSGPETTSDGSDLRLPDAHKELRHLSKDLKLTRDQKVVVGSILQERTREIHLLLDVQSLSEVYRNTLAAKVMQDSNAQIVTLLKNKQKKKFDKELAKERETR